MANLAILNAIGEIIGIGDVVGGDTAGSIPSTFNAGLLSGTASVPSQTPTGTNGAAVFQIGNASGNEIYSKNVEHWSGVPGVISIPAFPGSDKTDAAQVLYVNRNNQNIGIAYRDTRYTIAGGNVAPGETVVFAPGYTAKIKCGANGVFISTDTDSDTGSGVPAGSTTSLSITNKGLYYNAPWATISIDMNGIILTHASGASINLGAFAGLPGPLAALSSFVNISAGMINATAPSVNLGTGPVFGQAVIPLTPVWQPGSPLPLLTTTASSGVCISL